MNTITSLIWQAMGEARMIYKNQMDHIHEIKVRSVQHALTGKFSTYFTFGEDLNSMVDNLCDSKRFIKECEDLGMDPKIVGQHVVFAGKTEFNKVRDNGLKATFGPQVNDFNKPLYTEV